MYHLNLRTCTSLSRAMSSYDNNIKVPCWKWLGDNNNINDNNNNNENIKEPCWKWSGETLNRCCSEGLTAAPRAAPPFLSFNLTS